jgi:hypothetical protein
MKNKEDAFEKGYDSDGELGPFNNRIDKEGQQLFNEDDDDGVGFVAERAIDDERCVDTDAGDMDYTDVAIHVPILLGEINKMNMVQLTGFRLWRRYRRQYWGSIFLGAYFPQKWDVLPPF